MATEKNSALSAQANVLTTELNSLADGSQCDPSSEIDNTSSLNRYAIAELVVTFGTNPTALSSIDIYAIPAPDGTNYINGNASVGAAPQTWIGAFTVQATTNAQRLVSRRLELPNCKFKLLLKNRTGQTFAASGNILNLYTFNRTIS